LPGRINIPPPHKQGHSRAFPGKFCRSRGIPTEIPTPFAKTKTRRLSSFLVPVLPRSRRPGIVHSPTKNFLRNSRRPRWLRPLGTPEKGIECLSRCLLRKSRRERYSIFPFSGNIMMSSSFAQDFPQLRGVLRKCRRKDS